MIRITVEIVPGGFEPLRRVIATMLVDNLSNLADRSDYRVRATEKESGITGLRARSMGAEVKNHDRRQSVWALIAKAASAVAAAEAEPSADG
jgi:hypothetical protein